MRGHSSAWWECPAKIAIGGKGVTLGYLDRPELTAERVAVDPFSNAPGALLSAG